MATNLEPDVKPIVDMRDRHILDLMAPKLSLQTKDLLSLLGISLDWGPARIRKHLRAEFHKWNSRISGLEGDRREKAGHLLSLITKAYQKYKKVGDQHQHIFALLNPKLPLKTEDSLSLLGISSDWDSARIQKHLRVEFHKWNSRITRLEGDRHEKAKYLLSQITKAYQKYK